MKEYAIRLTRGEDLKKRIEEVASAYNTVVVLSAVGCVSEFKVRLAGAKSFLEKKEDFEIVSVTGTVCNGKAHLHVSFADKTGATFGGHMDYGCIVDTTCELFLGIIEEYKTMREYDSNTDFNELVIVKK